MKRLCIVILASICASPGLAQTKVQRNVLQNLGMLTLVEEICPSWRKNDLMIAVELTKVGIKADDIDVGGKFHSVVASTYQLMKSKTTEAGHADIFCGLAATNFGPGGSLIPNGILLR